MNNIKNQSAVASTTDNIIQKNVSAWQEAKREAARHARAAREAREFRANFGSVRFAFPSGLVLV